MKNIGAERQLSEYNHLYKENTALYRDLSLRMGLTESTFWILYTLRVEEAPVTQSDMCAILGYPKKTVNSALKKMEQEGYITRKADEQDQRVMRLTLAQKGKDCIAYVIKTAEKLEEIVFEGMSAEEKMLFRRLLMQILENLE